ncbi:hypothetical protein GJ496_004262 [Pomphorhynchus laevis]|nr:hypothetical protein GJ496_004262 [Pomphorhynchus laevis]
MKNQGSDKIKIQNDKSSENQDLVKVQYRGNVPVDPYFDCASGFIVYRDHSNMDWDCMLNQTNVGKNNNKFYVIQLLTGNSEFRIFKRWGRIGEKGQKNIESFSNIDDAKSCFINLFKRKTGVKWDTNIYANFQKCHGKYDLIQRDFAVDDKYESEPVEIKIPESTLSKDVQELIALICNESLIITSLKELNYDASKAPLGKLSTHQIELGYSALKEIEQCILGNASSSYLKEACSLYYTRIPHVFRRSGIELIDTIQRLKEELNLLSSLDDARAAVKMFAQECSSVNPIDRHYEQLNCGIKLLSHDFEIFTKIKESLISTHAVKNHGFKIEVIDVFELEKSIEAFNDVGNKRLLWHGSRLMNFAGILGRGLKIAPPEAPSTGYMFGKGVYFADVSSKSAQYCYACSSNSTCFMLLAEVSLGESHRLLSSEHRLPKLLPKGKHSTHGVGKWIPAGTDYIQGLPIPKGPIVQQGKDLLKDGKLASLQFNEFIVYSTSQIRLRYLVKLKIIIKMCAKVNAKTMSELQSSTTFDDFTAEYGRNERSGSNVSSTGDNSNQNARTQR